MVRFLLILLVFVFISSGCQNKSENGSQQNQGEDGQRPSEPIPVNPQHS